MKTKRGN